MRPYIQTQRIKFKNNYSGIFIPAEIASDEFLVSKFFQLIRKYGKCTQKQIIREIQRRKLWLKYPELKPYFVSSTNSLTIASDTYTLEHIPSCFGNIKSCKRCFCHVMLACMEASQI